MSPAESTANTPSGPPAVIQCDALHKTFKDFWQRPRVEALRGITFSVPQNSVFGFLGPNGSGKSTTLKLILGLLRPTSGSVRVFARPPSAMAVKQRIGYMPEESHLYPALTPKETLDFYSTLFRLPAATQRERVAQLLDMLDLARVANRAVGEFSKGMARRVSLAQALLNNPDLLILDEPTSGLDPEGMRQVKDLIQALAKSGKTIFLTSHLLTEVEAVCDQAAILGEGRILAQGALDTLLSNEDATSLTFPTPKQPATLQTLLDQARQTLGETPAITHPKRGLEEYFLQTIRQASPSPAATPPIATFLR